MNYRKELTKFIEQRIINILSTISKINYKMNHINSDFPREELIAEIKKSTHSLNGVLLNLFGNNYLKREYIKYRKEEIREELKEARDIREEYVNLLDCIENKRRIRLNEITVDVIIDFAQTNNLNYEELIELLRELDVISLDIEAVIAIAKTNTKHQYALYIESITNEHQLHGKKEDREALLDKKDKIDKLSQYYSNGKIINPTKNIEEFMQILDGLDLEEQSKKKLIKDMEAAIEKRQDKEYAITAEKVLRSVFSEGHIARFFEAERMINENVKNPLIHLIKNAYKNILSLCKYLSILPEGSGEWSNILELLDAEIMNLETIMNISLSKDLYRKMPFNYLLKGDESLQIKEDIDFIEETKYGTAAESLFKLQNGIHVVEAEIKINGIEVKITEGPVNIAYVEIDGVKMIIALAQTGIKERVKGRLENKAFVSNLYKQIRRLKEDPEEVTKTRLYHEVIMSNLDIFNPPGMHTTSKLV